MSGSSSEYLIVGAGPTGLGAAWALQNHGVRSWQLLEEKAYAGGLATSFIDEQGFTWDIGGHVQFSHYELFDRVMDDLLGAEGWLEHERESWVWMRGRFVPYPIQNNLHRLPEADRAACLAGLTALPNRPDCTDTDFRSWILRTFGAGFAEIFMLPYNLKVWGYPAEKMSAVWVGDRVAALDPQKLVERIELGKDDVSWGPNHTFRFPRRGGTGAIWQEFARRLPTKQLIWQTSVRKIDLRNRKLWSETGDEHAYESLISTMPLTELLRVAGLSEFLEVAERGLLHSSSNIVGIGLAGKVPETLRTKCWMYFPEDNCPFYRVTVFSNYSPHNVPDATRHWSLMAEVSESPYREVNQATLIEEVLAGLRNVGLLSGAEPVVSTWKYRAEYGYPTPGLQRDAALAEILPFLEKHGVYSRGRFGAWKYEVSNQDHSFMQGVEVVERLLHGREEITVADANHANSRKHPFPFARWLEGGGR